MKTLLKILGFIFLAIYFTACVSTKMVAESEDGGHIQYGTDTNAAIVLMKAKCPEGYAITEMGVVDKSVHTPADIKERYLNFKCFAPIPHSTKGG